MDQATPLVPNVQIGGGFITTPPTKPTSERAKVLAEASGLVDGQRDQQYGSPQVNFDNIATLWNAQLKDRLINGFELTAADVALLLAGLKLARAITNPNHRDNYVDLAGYAAIAAELVQGENS